MRRSLLWFATVAVVLAAGYGLWRFLAFDRAEFLEAAAQLPQELAGARAEGIPLEPADLQVEVDPKENAGPVLKQAIQEVRLAGASAPIDSNAMLLADYGPGPALAAAEAIERRLSKLWPLTHKAASLPKADLGRDWSQAAAFSLPEFSEIKNLVKLLAGRALVSAARGDLATAVQTLEDAAKITAHVAQEPTLIAMLVAVAQEAIVLATYDRIISASASDSAALQQLEGSLRRLPPPPSFLHALGGEVWLSRVALREIDSTEALAKLTALGDEESTEDWSMPLGLSIEDMVKAFKSRHISYWRRLFKAVRAAGSDEVAISRASEKIYEEEERQKGRTYAVNRVLAPVFSQASLAIARLRAKRELLRAKIDLLLYRIRSGKYADKLELVGRYVDVFDKKPLRYQLEPEGFVVYSIGSNFRDDSGRQGYDGDEVVRHPIPKTTPKLPAANGE
jgi:hypothetical protein